MSLLEVTTPDQFECIGRWRRSAWCTKAELSEPADSETTRRATFARWVTENWKLGRERLCWHGMAEFVYDPASSFPSSRTNGDSAAMPPEGMSIPARYVDQTRQV